MTILSGQRPSVLDMSERLGAVLPAVVLQGSINTLCTCTLATWS